MASNDEQRILITQATPGMVLSQAVFTQNRVPLCSAGTTLSDELIHRLTMRGVKRIHVKGTPLPTLSQGPFEEQARACRERFSRIEHTLEMGLIRDAIIDVMARRP